MDDYSHVLELLRINGITKNSTFEEVDRIFTALKYTEDDKQKIYNFLKNQGYFEWNPSQPPIPSSSNENFVASSNNQPSPTNSDQSPNINQSSRSSLVSQNNFSQNSNFSKPSKKAFNLKFTFLILILILVVGGGLFYAYVAKIGPFSSATYAEADILSGVLSKGQSINSASYSGGFSLNVVSRENGAVSFSVKNPNDAKLREKFQNDFRRAQDTEEILSNLYYSSSPYNQTNKTYPAALSTPSKIGGYYNNYSILDPATKEPYRYELTENGRNFKLTINFETNDAVRGIKSSYRYSATSTFVNGNTVTFTKDSPTYFYLSQEPPKPFFQSLAEMSQYIPLGTKISGTVNATADWSKGDVGDWIFNLNGEGAFGNGDLTYKLNGDAIKKDQAYYIRINNFPIFFLGDMASIEGQWIKIPTIQATSTSSSYGGDITYLTNSIPNAEKEYKKNRTEVLNILKKAAKLGDKNKLIKFKNPPHAEKIDGRSLTRYDLELRKEAILPFYTELLAEINKTNSDAVDVLNDQGLLDYFKSSEFDQTFDYYNKNTWLTLWVDSAGYPAKLEYGMRIVPPDSVTQLKDKQINITLGLSFKDINKSVNIQAPTNYKDIKQIEEEMNNTPAAKKNKSAQIQAQINGLRTAAENVYSKTNSYGTVSYTVAACSKKTNTLFGDNQVFTYIQNATDQNPSFATCASDLVSYAVSVPLPSAPGYSWCVDSLGNSLQISGAITSAKCR